MPKKKEGKLLGFVVVNLHSVSRDLFVCDSEGVVYSTYSQARMERDSARKDSGNPHIVVAAVHEIVGELKGENHEVVSDSERSTGRTV